MLHVSAVNNDRQVVNQIACKSVYFILFCKDTIPPNYTEVIQTPKILKCT